MAFWKTPPKAKVYEALSTVADGPLIFIAKHIADEYLRGAKAA